MAVMKVLITLRHVAIDRMAADKDKAIQADCETVNLAIAAASAVPIIILDKDLCADRVVRAKVIEAIRNSGWRVETVANGDLSLE